MLKVKFGKRSKKRKRKLRSPGPTVGSVIGLLDRPVRDPVETRPLNSVRHLSNSFLIFLKEGRNFGSDDSTAKWLYEWLMSIPQKDGFRSHVRLGTALQQKAEGFPFNVLLCFINDR